MQRSKFLAVLSAVFLAPFGIKAKPDYVIFAPNPADVGKGMWWFTAVASGPQTLSFSGPKTGTHYINIPDNGEHDICIRFDGHKTEYYIDGDLIEERIYHSTLISNVRNPHPYNT